MLAKKRRKLMKEDGNKEQIVAAGEKKSVADINAKDFFSFFCAVCCVSFVRGNVVAILCIAQFRLWFY